MLSSQISWKSISAVVENINVYIIGHVVQDVVQPGKLLWRPLVMNVCTSWRTFFCLKKSFGNIIMQEQKYDNQAWLKCMYPALGLALMLYAF